MTVSSRWFSSRFAHEIDVVLAESVIGTAPRGGFR
eukprot:COSAG02_NODE_3764_length_6270_cov_2.684978_1_plen_34_part_10